ncbi:MAG TPA: hypothetical protein DCE02_05060 [Ruminiclostridium sp.]|jgi:hypothetical protein|uniref:Uncharacterized protein n=1 Tax=Acetivibrio saccincola TaxID=1677857 RepID=A0A2K9EQE8_9FIRM|nr:hypothetical protein HVS_09070 [Acetivibrio saccincola]PQQ67611.1 hypothetical protein B9R14_13205 [Acetivibrio saccincola]HAA43357.1 hypothetical protein [Ruminiclostridium sp.]
MGKLFGLDKIGDKSQLCIDYFKLKKGSVICLFYFIYFIFKITIWKNIVFNGIDIKNSKGVILLLFFYFLFMNLKPIPPHGFYAIY